MLHAWVWTVVHAWFIGSTGAGEKAIIIDGVGRFRLLDPLFESVRVILSHRGELYSPAYIQGISGAAFRIAGICPCAPTCSFAMRIPDLVELLGYEVEDLQLDREGTSHGMNVHEMLARPKDEIRANRSAILFHAFTNPEWDVICGFDGEKHQLVGRGSYVGLEEYATGDKARTNKCIDVCPVQGAILIGEKVGELNAREAELNALREASSHAHSRRNAELLGGDKWVMLDGLLCYDRWVNSFKVHPRRHPTWGDRYCFGVYRSKHRAASEFMCELAPRYPKAAQHIEHAAESFTSEADALNECAKMLFPGWRLPHGTNRETNDRTATMLSKARGNYARGIEEIDRALHVIDD